MLTHDYRYDTCLEGSIKNAWTVDDCFQGRDFDFSKAFLPERIAGVGAIGCLSDEEKLKLNQIRGNSYCHIFAFRRGVHRPDGRRPRPAGCPRRRDPPLVAAALCRRGGQASADAATGLRASSRPASASPAGWCPVRGGSRSGPLPRPRSPR